MDIINVIDDWLIGLDNYIIFKTIVARLKCLLSALLIMHKHEHSIPYLHFINNFIYQENKFNGVGISYIKSPCGFGPYTHLLKHNNKWIFQIPNCHVIHISHQFHSVYLRIKYSGFMWIHIYWTCCPGITGILYFDVKINTVKLIRDMYDMKKWIFQVPIFHVIHISYQFHSVYLNIKYSGFLWMHIDWTCCPGITGILYFDPCYLQSRSCHYILPSFIHDLYLKQFNHRSICMTDHVCYYLHLCSSYWSPHS